MQFAFDETRSQLYKFASDQQAGYTKKIRKTKRSGFTAWIHRLAGNEHVGYALLRCGASLDHMVRLTEAYYKLRVRGENESDDEVLQPRPKRNTVLGNIAGIS